MVGWVRAGCYLTSVRLALTIFTYGGFSFLSIGIPAGRDRGWPAHRGVLVRRDIREHHRVRGGPVPLPWVFCPVLHLAYTVMLFAFGFNRAAPGGSVHQLNLMIVDFPFSMAFLLGLGIVFGAWRDRVCEYSHATDDRAGHVPVPAAGAGRLSAFVRRHGRQRLGSGRDRLQGGSDRCRPNDDPVRRGAGGRSLHHLGRNQGLANVPV